MKARPTTDKRMSDTSSRAWGRLVSADDQATFYRQDVRIGGRTAQYIAECDKHWPRHIVALVLRQHRSDLRQFIATETN